MTFASRRRGRGVGAALALASCAHDPPLPPPPPAPILADVAPISPEAPTGPEPLSDGPAVLGSICTPVWAVHDDGSRRIACTTHGPYSTSTAFKGSAVGEHRGDAFEVCDLTSMLRGSFTRPGAKEVLLGFNDCNDRGRGASPFVVLLSVGDDGSYRSIAYENDLRAERCERTRRADGRDILYCELRKQVPNVGTGTAYVVADFARPGKRLGVVATLMQHDFTCSFFQKTAQSTMRRGFVWMAAPAFHTDAGRLVVQVDRTYAPPSPGLDAALLAECQAHPDTDGRDVLPTSRREAIVIEPKTDTYGPTAEAKVLLDQWTRELNDGRLRSTISPVWTK